MAVYAGLCTLVHHKKRGGWSSPAGHASLRTLIIKDMHLGTWKFLGDCSQMARHERFLGKRNGVASMAGRGSETLNRAELEALQLNRLRETVRRLERVPFYRAKFRASRLKPEDLKTADDIRRLPFTTAADL